MNNDTKQLILDYQEVFGSAAGRRVLDKIRTVSYYDSDIFRPGKPDETVFRLGMREVFWEIIKMINADPNAEVQDTYPDAAG